MWPVRGRGHGERGTDRGEEVMCRYSLHIFIIL
jgi:hypothetical protein